jgi:hypothetical protein
MHQNLELRRGNSKIAPTKSIAEPENISLRNVKKQHNKG